MLSNSWTSFWTMSSPNWVKNWNTKFRFCRRILDISGQWLLNKLIVFSKFQLVVYCQCCALIGWAFTWMFLPTSSEIFWPTCWILLEQLFLSASWPLRRASLAAFSIQSQRFLKGLCKQLYSTGFVWAIADVIVLTFIILRQWHLKTVFLFPR